MHACLQSTRVTYFINFKCDDKVVSDITIQIHIMNPCKGIQEILH